MMSLEFFIDIISQPHYGPGIDSTSNRNEYQEYFLGGKGGRCVELTNLPNSWTDCLAKSGSFKLLETSVPVQACNGVALPLNVLKSGSLNLLELSGPVQACNGIALHYFWLNYKTQQTSKIWHWQKNCIHKETGSRLNSSNAAITCFRIHSL
jgi:hypothetical protein